MKKIILCLTYTSWGFMIIWCCRGTINVTNIQTVVSQKQNAEYIGAPLTFSKCNVVLSFEGEKTVHVGCYGLILATCFTTMSAVAWRIQSDNMGAP